MTEEEIARANLELEKGAPKTQWIAGNLIRHKRTGQPFFVIHVFSGVCTLIVNMLDSTENPDVRVLFERDYDYFTIDHNERDIVKKNINLDEDVTFTYDPL